MTAESSAGADGSALKRQFLEFDARFLQKSEFDVLVRLLDNLTTIIAEQERRLAILEAKAAADHLLGHEMEERMHRLEAKLSATAAGETATGRSTTPICGSGEGGSGKEAD